MGLLKINVLYICEVPLFREGGAGHPGHTHTRVQQLGNDRPGANRGGRSDVSPCQIRDDASRHQFTHLTNFARQDTCRRFFEVGWAYVFSNLVVTVVGRPLLFASRQSQKIGLSQRTGLTQLR